MWAGTVFQVGELGHMFSDALWTPEQCGQPKGQFKALAKLLRLVDIFEAQVCPIWRNSMMHRDVGQDGFSGWRTWAHVL
jgi:hypothetical protein